MDGDATSRIAPPARPGQHQTMESWDVTEELVRKTIESVCGLDYQYTAMIERCHRGLRSRNYRGEGPAPIYAAMYDWKDCEYLMKKFREHNINNPGSKVRVEYKYGPLTTKRRNLAMAERKRLKSTGGMVSAYVAYSAKLMVKTSPHGKYKLHQDFSNAKVEFGGKRDKFLNLLLC